MFAGADHVSSDEESLYELARTSRGADGTEPGVPVALELAPVPTRFVAVTLKVYVVPLVRPITVHESAVVATQLAGTGTLGDAETV